MSILNEIKNGESKTIEFKDILKEMVQKGLLERVGQTSNTFYREKEHLEKSRK